MALDPTRRPTPPHSSGTPAIDVSITWVQEQLNRFRRSTGQAPIAVDGVAGPNTAAATHDFIVRLGVPADGILAGQLYDVANAADGTPGRVRMTIPLEQALDGRAPGATGNPYTSSSSGGSSTAFLALAAVGIVAFAYTRDKKATTFRGLGSGKLVRFPEGVMTEEEWVHKYADRVEEYAGNPMNYLNRRKFNRMDAEEQAVYERGLQKRHGRTQYRAWRGDVFHEISRGTYKKATP